MNEIRNLFINIGVLVIICGIGFCGGYLYANKRANESIADERAKYSESKLQYEARIIQYQTRIEELGKQQDNSIAVISSGTVAMAGYSDIIGAETGKIFKILNEVRGTNKILENNSNN